MRVFSIVLACCLFAACARNTQIALPVAPANEEETRRLIPDYARMLGLDLGFDTQDKLELKIGAGKIAKGGHSNSGRKWDFTSNGLSLFADGFDMDSGEQYILDTLVFSEWKGRLEDCRELQSQNLGPWGALQRAATPEQCLATLPRALRESAMEKKDEGQPLLEWTHQIQGFRNGVKGTGDYTATLGFDTANHLQYLRLVGYFDVYASDLK